MWRRRDRGASAAPTFPVTHEVSSTPHSSGRYGSVSLRRRGVHWRVPMRCHVLRILRLNKAGARRCQGSGNDDGKHPSPTQLCTWGHGSPRAASSSSIPAGSTHVYINKAEQSNFPHQSCTCGMTLYEADPGVPHRSHSNAVFPSRTSHSARANQSTRQTISHFWPESAYATR